MRWAAARCGGSWRPASFPGSDAQARDTNHVSLGFEANNILDEKQRTFLETHHAAAMITIAGDGMPKAVRVGVALVQGRIWSSGTADRVRTKRLRRDPRCSLFVFDQEQDGWFAWDGNASSWVARNGADAPVIEHIHFTGTGTRVRNCSATPAI